MCSPSYFFTNAHFHLASVAASISYFLPATTKFLCCSSNKKMSPLSPIFRWASLACCLISLALFSKFVVKFVVMTINLSLILQTTRIQKQYPLYVFILIDSLVVSALQDCMSGQSFGVSYRKVGRLNYQDLDSRPGSAYCFVRLEGKRKGSQTKQRRKRRLWEF